MAIVASKRNLFEPIVIEIDGKTIEICSCGQTKKQDRTCDEAHDILNAEIEAENATNTKIKKTMTVEQVLNKINKELQSEKSMCACGGNCQCGSH